MRILSWNISTPLTFLKIRLKKEKKNFQRSEVPDVPLFLCKVPGPRSWLPRESLYKVISFKDIYGRFMIRRLPKFEKASVERIERVY